MNNARRILSKGSTLLRGCWFWSTKLHFQKNFGRNFIAVEGVRAQNILLLINLFINQLIHELIIDQLTLGWPIVRLFAPLIDWHHPSLMKLQKISY